ncbi:hypothetical protein [Pseudooceanicola nitratireducens]|nr:hypothetical protein [Pseudooceanicola nitratireducens]
MRRTAGGKVLIFLSIFGKMMPAGQHAAGSLGANIPAGHIQRFG